MVGGLFCFIKRREIQLAGPMVSAHSFQAHVHVSVSGSSHSALTPFLFFYKFFLFYFYKNFILIFKNQINTFNLLQKCYDQNISNLCQNKLIYLLFKIKFKIFFTFIL